MYVRRERILVRGLKHNVVRVVETGLVHGDGQKRTNPREGIETEHDAIIEPRLIDAGQKRTNPREGIETLAFNGPVAKLHCVRRERILVRGLKPIRAAASCSDSRVSVRRERILVRGLKRTSMLMSRPHSMHLSQKRTNPREGIETRHISAYPGWHVLFVRRERILVRGLKPCVSGHAWSWRFPL